MRRTRFAIGVDAAEIVENSHRSRRLQRRLDFGTRSTAAATGAVGGAVRQLRENLQQMPAEAENYGEAEGKREGGFIVVE